MDSSAIIKSRIAMLKDLYNRGTVGVNIIQNKKRDRTLHELLECQHNYVALTNTERAEERNFCSMEGIKGHWASTKIVQIKRKFCA